MPHSSPCHVAYFVLVTCQLGVWLLLRQNYLLIRCSLLDIPRELQEDDLIFLSKSWFDINWFLDAPVALSQSPNITLCSL